LSLVGRVLYGGTVNSTISFVLILAVMSGFAMAGEPNLKSVVVFEQEGRFGGWPANHGIWSWGDEILVGFAV